MVSTNNKGLNAGNLKMIALFCMVIDHSAVALVLSYLNTIPQGQRYDIIFGIYYVMRMIGRIAFPIYCYFITEGYEYTKSKIKYALRLLILAILSEIPFDMVLHHKCVYTNYQNVFWTLFVGLITIWVIDFAEQKKINKYIKYIFKFVIISAACYLAEYVIKSDYGSIGVFAVVSVYLVRKNEKKLAFTAYIVALCLSYFSNYNPKDSESILAGEIALLSILLFGYILNTSDKKKKEMAICCSALFGIGCEEIFAFPGVFLVTKYNGKRGRINKWFFYLSYPTHLLILALICQALNLY